MRFWRRRWLYPKPGRWNVTEIDESVRSAALEGWDVEKTVDVYYRTHAWLVGVPWRDPNPGNASYGLLLSRDRKMLIFTYGAEGHLLEDGLRPQHSILLSTNVCVRDVPLSEHLKAWFADPERYPPNRWYAT
jgi:hypothetical protein